MTKIYDGMRVVINDKSSGWMCHDKFIERQQEKIDALDKNGVLEFRYETKQETCVRLGGILEIRKGSTCAKSGSEATIRDMTFYNMEIPRPLPPWLEFHKKHPDFEKFKAGFYAREGHFYFGEIGIYTNNQEPPPDGIRSYHIWIVEFDGIKTTPEDGYAGCGPDGLLPDYLEEITNV